jgi:hypothetical protein
MSYTFEQQKQEVFNHVASSAGGIKIGSIFAKCKTVYNRLVLNDAVTALVRENKIYKEKITDLYKSFTPKEKDKNGQAKPPKPKFPKIEVEGYQLPETIKNKVKQDIQPKAETDIQKKIEAKSPVKIHVIPAPPTAEPKPVVAKPEKKGRVFGQLASGSVIGELAKFIYFNQAQRNLSSQVIEMAVKIPPNILNELLGRLENQGYIKTERQFSRIVMVRWGTKFCYPFKTVQPGLPMQQFKVANGEIDSFETYLKSLKGSDKLNQLVQEMSANLQKLKYLVKE